MTYRMDLPTMVLAFLDNHQAAITIPAGGIVEVIGPAEDDRFSVVSVNGEQFHVFAVDLADRGKQIEAVVDRVTKPNSKDQHMPVPAMKPDAKDTATKSPELLEQEQIASLAYAVAASDGLSRRVTNEDWLRAEQELTSSR